MSISGTYRRSGRALRRLLRLLARPVKGDRGRGGMLVQPYRGYGTREEVFLMGRVFRQTGVGAHVREGSSSRDVLDLVRRFLRWGVADALLQVRFYGTEQEVRTDRDGYFRVHLRPQQPPPPGQLWHEMDLELIEPVSPTQAAPPAAGDSGTAQLDAPRRARGEIFIAPDTARRLIISDIDDTVMYTGVVNKIKMMWRLFIQGPRSRVAFPGVTAFYRALYHGPGGDERNPLLYVSRAPWSIYEVLEEFFHLHRIPVGPVLFLREWGLTLQRPWPRRARDHKLILIRHMLEIYRDMPVVLIGDSGQHDPEIYARIVHEHPGRVVATYIRNVSRDPRRAAAIQELADEVVQAGSSLLLAADSLAMAEHAAEHHLIPPQALAEVKRQRSHEQDQDQPQQAAAPTYTIVQPPQATTETDPAEVSEELQEALQQETGDEDAPNIAVEPAKPSSERQVP